MQFPLDLRFKIIALASQIYVTDSAGADVFYVKQKLIKLKENIEIYRSSAKDQLVYTVRADRVIDFSPEFTLRDGQSEQELGSIKRLGARSLWKASYDIAIGGKPFAHIREANGWVKVMDGFLSQIPIIDMLAGYVFHPTYLVEDTSGKLVATLEKKPAFFEGKFELKDSGISSADETTQLIFAALLMTVALMERSRG